MRKLFHFQWYVLFISIYPALFYWSYNSTEMSYINGRKLVLISFLLGLFTWGLILLITRNFKTASMTTFLVLLLFWTYGHVYNYFHPLYPMVFDYKFIGACWLLLFVVGIWLIRKSLSKHDLTPVILNLITAFLVLFPAIKIIPHYIQEMRLAQDNNNQIMQVSITGISEPKYSYRPDIYYIILDSYPRENILREYFNFNNSKIKIQQFRIKQGKKIIIRYTVIFRTIL